MKYSVKSILFLGVGGISMHQLALIFKTLGVKVYGYDMSENKYTKLCAEKGVKVTQVFDKSFCNVDLCIKTSAIKSSKYLDCLKKRNVPVVERAEILGWITKKFPKVIAVAGTHGKTTTASLIYEVLRQSGKKVSCHIGADVDFSRFDFEDEFLVVEACEFNKSFLKLKPTISVVTNIEKEHMESYGNIFNLRSAFLTFMKKAETKFVSDNNTTKFLKKYSTIKFVENSKKAISPTLRGEYNLQNISLAMSVCEYLGIDEKIILNVVNTFSGVKRRYETLGQFKNNKVVIDYAHHPTEVKVFVETFTQVEEKAQIIFQPHTYSRTKQFQKEFVEIFSNLKNPIILKEYSARETKDCGMSAKELFVEIKKLNKSVKYCPNKKSLLKHLKTRTSLAFVGAGNINLVAEELVETIKCNS